MQDYSFKVLYSGSTGNAALLSSGEVRVLIDAGRCARDLTASLVAAGASPAALRAIFLTHEHRDHTAALDVFLRHYPVPVHVPEPCVARLARDLSPAARECLCPHPPLFCCRVGNLCFTSFDTPHDSAACVGYRIGIECKEATHTIGYATDVGYVSPSVEAGLTGCEAVVIECNHDEDMLWDGPYPAELKRRIAARYGHLSNAACAALAAKLAACGTRRLLLAHLSETNNLPELALGEVCAALAGTDVTVRAASPTDITEL